VDRSLGDVAPRSGDSAARAGRDVATDLAAGAALFEEAAAHAPVPIAARLLASRRASRTPTSMPPSVPRSPSMTIWSRS
jgi:hypothetical protein